MGYIYKITNKINNKAYIGQTRFTIEIRWAKHLKDSKIEKIKERPLYRAFNKYGIENFIIEKLEECSNEYLNEREIFYISLFNSFKEGYNLTNGGEGSSTINKSLIIQLYTIEERSIHEISQITGYARSSISNCLKSNNILIRQNVLDEQKIILMYLNGMSIYQITKETGHSKGSISALLKRNNITIVNKREKKPVVQKDLSGNIINIFESVHAAQREMQKQGKSSTSNLTNILKCLNNKLETLYGFRWEFK